ncbi:hypothetical protein ACA910_009672 [Epithemia clementina (nom. ined.)]
MLLLDEPTASLDAASEKKVAEALKCSSAKEQTIVVVSHRLGILRSIDVNRIVVMDGGRIVESGHPRELSRRSGGWYAQMLRQQATAEAI